MKKIKIQLTAKMLPELQVEFPITKQMKKLFQKEADINKTRVTEASNIILNNWASNEEDKLLFQTSIANHDASKYTEPEYYGYVMEFARDNGLVNKNYGGEQVACAIDTANLHHWANNKHHIEYWQIQGSIQNMSYPYLCHWFCDDVYAECTKNNSSGIEQISNYVKRYNFSEIQKSHMLRLITLFPSINY